MRSIPLTMGEQATLWVDEPRAPMHIALAGEFDGTRFARADGSIDVEHVRAELVRRADRVPMLRRRVVWTRLGRGRPSWADDPAFDAAQHVSAAQLPEGQTFHDCCANAILRPLDHHRPLWRAEVVGGLPDGRFGALIVVHHVVAGGLAGVALAATLLDTVPDAVALPAHPGESTPGTTAPVQLRPPDRARSSTVLERIRRRWRRLAQTTADVRTRAPVTSLSGQVGPRRRVAAIRFPLADLRETGHGLGVSVNDLLLAAVTGGLRKLLGSRGDDLDGLVMRASVPVGSPTAGQPDGMLLVGLPVGEPDLLRRLAIIRRSTARLKSQLRAGGGSVFDVLRLPRPAARLAVRWMRSIAGCRINLFVTNVPGPKQPLWLAGARLLQAVPVAPLTRVLPLSVAALSYTGTLFIGINADDAVEDIEKLATVMHRALAELTEAARTGVRLPAAGHAVRAPHR